MGGCTCLELSTNKTDASFRVEGDWCLHNSARLLCDLLGFCGIWGCRIDDFMCPRYEWNKKLIPLKGLGSCDRSQYTGAQLKAASLESVSAAPRVAAPALSFTLGLAAAVAGLLYFIDNPVWEERRIAIENQENAQAVVYTLT